MDNENSFGLDPAFGISDFNDFKVYNHHDTLIKTFLMLLFMRPGAMPSLPHIGMDISQYLYMHINDIPIEAIKTELVSQCEAFLPYVQSNQFNIIKTEVDKKPVLAISLPVEVKDDDIKTAIIGIGLNNTNEIVLKYDLFNENE